MPPNERLVQINPAGQSISSHHSMGIIWLKIPVFDIIADRNRTSRIYDVCMDISSPLQAGTGTAAAFRQLEVLIVSSEKCSIIATSSRELTNRTPYMHSHRKSQRSISLKPVLPASCLRSQPCRLRHAEEKEHSNRKKEKHQALSLLESSPLL